MADDFRAPFGAYTSAQALSAPIKAEVTANINLLIALLDDGAGGAGRPDFNKIGAGQRAGIIAELNGIKAAVAAAA